MKKIILLLIAATGVTFAQAQKMNENAVPAPVRSGLQKQFPGTNNVKWEKEKGNYEAGFKSNGTDYSVLLNADGKIIETEIAMSVHSLAAPVKEYVAKNYPGQKLKGAAKITDAKGIVTYEAELEGKDLIFDASGKFLKVVND